MKDIAWYEEALASLRDSHARVTQSYVAARQELEEMRAAGSDALPTLTDLERAEIYLALKLLRNRIEVQNVRWPKRPDAAPNGWEPSQIRELGERFR